MVSPHEEELGMSSASLSISGGSMVNMWSAVPSTMTDGQYTLTLAPDQAAVIGRQQGGQTEYLDPKYQPTQLMPGSTKPIVASAWEGKDRSVSRGHFMLKGSAQGILLVNGVPKRGGGIRPPTNWTWMLEPSRRMMEKGEEVMIKRGNFVQIYLPNQAVIMIIAN
jgi:hypothetical protein